MDANAFLSQLIVCPKQLHEHGLGNVGGVFRVHLLLRRDGRPSGWVVKRLRSALYDEPKAAFSRFARQHQHVCAYFCRPDNPQGCAIPESYFSVSSVNLDENIQDMVPGREFIMVQRFICGFTLREATRRYGKKCPQWLIAALENFVGAYYRMQHETQTILDVLSLSSDHVKVDPIAHTLYVVDTNNLISIAEGLRDNSLARKYCQTPAEEMSVAELHDVQEALIRNHDFDPHAFYSPDKTLNTRQARVIADLCRYFPKEGAPNRYVESLIQTFGL